MINVVNVCFVYTKISMRLICSIAFKDHKYYNSLDFVAALIRVVSNLSMCSVEKIFTLFRLK